MRFIAAEYFSLILYVALGTATIQAQPRNFSIVGQAIDVHGQSLKDIVLTLHYSCRGCTDSVLPVMYAHSDGTFWFPVTAYSKGLKLYIEERYPDNSWSPFHGPPFDGLSHLRIFRGMLIPRPKDGTNLDLGRVVVKLRYAVVKLDLESLLGSQYIPKYSSTVKVTVRDSFKKHIVTGYLPDAAFDSTLTSVNTALPTGRWYATFSLGEGPSRINSPQVVIDVDKSLNVIVSVKPNRMFKPARRSS